jgi:protein-export membrane protein SecD
MDVIRGKLRAAIIVAVVVLAVIFVAPTVGFYDYWVDEYEEEHLWIGRPGGAGFETPAFIAMVGRILPHDPVKLGLDLKGGIYLVYEVDETGLSNKELKDAVNLTVEIIRKRIDELGVTEPEIQSEGSNRIVVKLPGISDPGRAKSLIGTTAELEFKLVHPANPVGEVARSYDEKKAAEEVKAPVIPLSDRITLYKADYIFYESDYDQVKKMFAEATEMGLVPTDYVVAYSNAINRDDDEVYAELGEAYRRVYILTEETEITGKYLRNANLGYDQYGAPDVEFAWNGEGAEIFSELTGRHINERLAILLDGFVQSAPNIASRISDKGQITGNFTSDEASDLALVLRSGALPAKLWLIQEKVVGPSLGRDSIRNGVLAALVGFLIVIVLVVVYYYAAGLVADVALILNLIIVLGVMVAIGATLTLPGIAGLILSVAMAIDANVLIYERIREERAAGKTVRASVETGYKRAFITILDSNVTTLIAGIALFLFGTGPVRGFAVTLTIGILTSMFTAIIVTKAVFDFFTGRREVKTIYIG